QLVAAQLDLRVLDRGLVAAQGLELHDGLGDRCRLDLDLAGRNRELEPQRPGSGERLDSHRFLLGGRGGRRSTLTSRCPKGPVKNVIATPPSSSCRSRSGVCPTGAVAGWTRFVRARGRAR